MSNRFDRFQSELDSLLENHRQRQLMPSRGMDFSSNDFLALSDSPVIRKTLIDALNEGIPLGSGGSRLLRGNHPAHTELERKAAQVFHCEKTLFFANGYSANFAVLTTLVNRHDLIVFDALSHASIREGISASWAKSSKFPHNDVDAAERVLEKWHRNRQKHSKAWIVVESLYSMDGDFAPLSDFLDLAQRFDALVLVDEAHATGVWGKRGHGLTEPFEGHPLLIAVHTCGKALGVAGALVCAPAILIDYLVNRSRPFIYSTAPPPINAIAVSAALDLLESEPFRREQLRELIDFANHALEQKIGIQGSGSQIIPFVVGEDKMALEAARAMLQAGFDVRAIRPPTVANGTARLRISITLNVDQRAVSEFFDALVDVVHEGFALSKNLDEAMV